MTLPFTRKEYAERLVKTRAGMGAAGIDYLVTVDPSNMSWLTGYDGWSFYTPQAVIVPPEGAPFWWGRGIDMPGAVRTVYMGEDHIRSFGDDYVQSTERHAMDHLSLLLAELGAEGARIGVELDNFYFSAASYLSLQKGLPQATWIDATSLVNWQRLVKSPQEISYMRRAGKIVEKMHSRILERIAPGMRKNDLVAEIYHAGITGTDEFGGDYPAIVPLAPTGKDASAAHLTWDDAPIEENSTTFFEIAGCHRRYHVPLCRTVHLGAPSRALLDAEEAVLEGLEAGLDKARAGNQARDIAGALYGALEKAGITKDGRCGYAIGLSYPPDWGERTVSFRMSDETALQPGMCFHFMPGIWTDDWGLEITESILIQENGPAECLADVPRQLFVKA